MKNIMFYTFLLISFSISNCNGESEKLMSSERSQVLAVLRDSVLQDTLERKHPIADSLPQKQAVIRLEKDLDPRNFSIHFLNERAKNKTLDLRYVNPYWRLPYPLGYMSADSVDYLYDLSRIEEEQKAQLLSGMRVNSDAYRDNPRFLKMFIKTPVVESKGNLVAVAFHASYYSNEEDILGTQGVAILYNEYGEEIKRIIDPKDGFYDIRLSEDGQYLMQKYGTNYGEDGGGELYTGFKFYETATGDLVYEWELGKKPYLDAFGFLPKPYHWSIIERSFGENLEIYLIDVEEGQSYFLKGDLFKHVNNPDYLYGLLKEFMETGETNFLIEKNFEKNK